jgi:hypothetical protein
MAPGPDTGLEQVGAKITSDPTCGPAIVDKDLDLAHGRFAFDSPTNDFSAAQALEIPLDGQFVFATGNLGIARLLFCGFSSVGGGMFATRG